MNRYSKRAYYDFSDMITMIAERTGPYDMEQKNISWPSITAAILENTTLQDIRTNEANTLLRKYLYPRFFESVVAFYDLPVWDEPATVQTYSDLTIPRALYGTFWREMTNRLIETQSRYKKLLDLYASKENELLARVGSNTVVKNRFNDTPQNASPDFWNDDAHATTASLQEQNTVADSGTVIQRLEEIRLNLRNIYKDWADEFAPLFMEV